MPPPARRGGRSGRVREACAGTLIFEQEASTSSVGSRQRNGDPVGDFTFSEYGWGS